MRERPNRHAWKACVGQPTVGSNPTPSAMTDDEAMALALDEARPRSPTATSRSARSSCATATCRPPPQRAGADRRPHRPRRDPGPARRRRRVGPLAARRLHARRDARAVRHVRRRRRQRPDRPARLRGRPTPRPAPSAASTTSPPTPASTTARRSSAACGPTECGALLRAFFADRRRAGPRAGPVASPTGRMPERTNGTASKAVEVLRASVGSNPTPSLAHTAQE